VGRPTHFRDAPVRTLVRPEGIEPPSFGLEGRCLIQLDHRRWKMVGMKRLELLASASQTQRSTKLSYIPIADLFLLPTRTASQSFAGGTGRSAQRTSPFRVLADREGSRCGLNTPSRTPCFWDRRGRTRERRDPAHHNRHTDGYGGAQRRTPGSAYGRAFSPRFAERCAPPNCLRSDGGNTVTCTAYSTN
jgi:hypothetical protein